MDNLDIGILSMLLGNCRESDRQIGSRLGISGGAVRVRRQRMEDCGVITRYVVKVEPPLLGHGVLYVVVTGQDTEEILEQCRLIGKPYMVVPCVGGITVCGVVVHGGNGQMEQKVRLARELMRDVRILSIFEAGQRHGQGTGPHQGSSGMTRTDMEVLGMLARSPRGRTDEIASEMGVSAKTVARCRDKLYEIPDVQFTLTYDPQKLQGYIPYAVLAWTRGEPSAALRHLDSEFSKHYLQPPFVAESQAVLFLYCNTIYEMDAATQRVRESPHISAADLFIPKSMSLYDMWLMDAIKDACSSPRLHWMQGG